jgi:hypothetical protein
MDNAQIKKVNDKQINSLDLFSLCYCSFSSSLVFVVLLSSFLQPKFVPLCLFIYFCLDYLRLTKGKAGL